MAKILKEKIIGMLFATMPFAHALCANKKIRKSIAELTDQYGNTNITGFNPDEPAKHLLAKYNRSIAIKEKLEDKAKSNMVGATISITLIMGASGVVSSATKNLSNAILTLTLFVIAVIFMIVAGVMAFQLLMDKIEVYFVMEDVDDLEKDSDLRSYCFESTVLNDKWNHIRNNFVFASFACIRNALICLFFVMVLMLSPLYTPLYFVNNVADQQIIQAGQIFYSAQAMSYLESHRTHQAVENRIWQFVNEGRVDSTLAINIIDSVNNLFIKVKLNADGNPMVLQIEQYIE